MKHIPLTNGWQFSLNGGEYTAVTLPHDFSIIQSRSPKAPSGKDGGWFECGKGIYMRTLERPEEHTVYFCSNGIQGLTEVWVNDDRVLFHPNGYTPIIADLTPWLKDGENTLVIKVNNRAQPIARWYTGSGMYRGAELLTGSRVYIPPCGLYIKTVSIADDKAKMHLELTLSGGIGDISADVFYPNGEKACTLSMKNACGKAVFDFEMNAELWSPNDPKLCNLIVNVTANGETDTETATFGIRTVTTHPEKGLLINGEPIKLRGGCIHHDNGIIGARSMRDAELRRVKKLKDVGFNALRMAHNPPSTELLNVCDELGILVIDEAFDCWVQGKVDFDYHIYFEDWWQRDVTALVTRDRNHPSVIIWSNGNEIPERGNNSNGHEIARRLTSHIRSLDDRPVTHALCGYWEVKSLCELQEKTKNDPIDAWASTTENCVKGLEIVGYNYLHDRVVRDRRIFPERLIMLTETMALQAAESWKAVADNAYVVGDFVWTAWDYFGESGIGHVAYDTDKTKGLLQYPCHIANCGDFDVCGRRRPQSYYREIIWGIRKAPYLSVIEPKNAARTCVISNWGFPDLTESWSFPEQEGKTARVYVFSNADECALTVNGHEVARQKVPENMMCVFETAYIPGEIAAIGYANGVETGRHALKTSENASALSVTDEFIGQDIAYAAVNVIDANGNVVPYADIELTIETDGCELLGAGNGDPFTEDDYFDNAIRAYRGSAAFAVRLNGSAPARVCVRSADGRLCAEWNIH